MLFKKITLFKITQPDELKRLAIEALIAKRPYIPAEASASLSAGWIPPLAQEEHAWVQKSQGALLCKLKIETRKVPGSVIRKSAETYAAKIEQSEHRKVGRKEFKEIKERLELELLQKMPLEYGKWNETQILIDLPNGYIWVDQSGTKAEQAIQLLRETLGSLPVALVHTTISPQIAMTGWLEHGASPGFHLNRSVNLESGSGGKLNAANVDLATPEIQESLKSGKMVRELSMNYEDRISFTLTDVLHLKKITFLDLLTEELKQVKQEDAITVWQSNMLLTVEEMRRLIKALITSLGDIGNGESHSMGHAKTEYAPELEAATW